MKMNILVWMLSAMILLAGVGVVSAAPYNLSIHTPSSTSVRPSGVYKFQLNISVDDGVNDVLNTSFAIDGTAVCYNSTEVTNATGQILLSCSYDTLSLAFNDTSTHTLVATIYPQVNSVAANNGSATLAGIRWDNTIPNTPVIVTPATSGATVRSSSSYAVTIVAGNTSACTLELSYDGGANYATTRTMTLSGSTCTYSQTNGDPSDGNVYWRVAATDGLNVSRNTAQQNVIQADANAGQVQITTVAGGQGGAVAGAAVNKAKNQKATMVLLIGAASIAAVLLLNGKKKR